MNSYTKNENAYKDLTASLPVIHYTRECNIIEPDRELDSFDEGNPRVRKGMVSFVVKNDCWVIEPSQEVTAVTNPDVFIQRLNEASRQNIRKLRLEPWGDKNKYPFKVVDEAIYTLDKGGRKNKRTKRKRTKRRMYKHTCKQIKGLNTQ
jgi:hypothetical protein